MIIVDLAFGTKMNCMTGWLGAGGWGWRLRLWARPSLLLYCYTLVLICAIVEFGAVQKCVQLLCKLKNAAKNEPTLVIEGVDIAENGPRHVCSMTRAREP